MKHTFLLPGMLLLALACLAGETKIKESQLPEPVRKAMASASQGAQVTGYSREVENGKTLYELNLKVDGRTKDMTFDADGRVASIEEQVALESLPAAVQDGLRRAAGKGQLGLVEKVTEGGRVFYEAQVKGGPHKEVKVGVDGAPL